MRELQRHGVLRQQPLEPFRPLDDGDLLRREHEVKIQPRDRRRTFEAVAVDVDERDRAWVLAHQDERRTLDGIRAKSQTTREALDEGRLAGAKLPVQRHDIAGAKRPPEFLAERLRFFHRGRNDRDSLLSSWCFSSHVRNA